MLTIKYINNQYDLVSSYFVDYKNAKNFKKMFSKDWIEWAIFDSEGKVLDKSSSSLNYL